MKNVSSVITPHVTSKAHASKDYPILKQIGFKLVKRSSNTNAASFVGSDGKPTPKIQPSTPAPAPKPSDGSGSGSAPGAFTVVTEPESYDSGDDFDYKGK